MDSYLLSCCRAGAEIAEAENDHRAAHRMQSNLVKEKTGWRCSTCGKFYPALEIEHNGTRYDPKSISKPLGRLLKFKKAASIFRGDHYYATNKKTLLKYTIDEMGNGTLTEEIPIMGDVCYVEVSPDGRSIATETFSGTAAVIDAEHRQTLAKRRGLCASGHFCFVGADKLVYFKPDDGIWCWDFRLNQEFPLWRPTAQWREGKERPLVCRKVLQLEPDRMVFQLGISNRNYAVELRGLNPVREVRLADSYAVSSLTHMPDPERYTLPVDGKILVYDGEFRLVDEFAYPVIREALDGGGVFAIEVFVGSYPHAAALSPNGMWVLFNYFTKLILMERNTGALRYCVYSYKGTTSAGSGFWDDNHIWYSWADSRYIMEI